MPSILFTSRNRPLIEAVIGALVPRYQRFSDNQKKEAVKLIDRILASKPKSVISKIKLFLILIEMVSVVRGGRCFKNLSPEKQKKVLNFFFDSPLPLLRKGFWGINTLAKLGVYGQPSVYDEIGYVKRPL